MSRRHDVQDATGQVISYEPAGILYKVSSSSPAGGEIGYAPGCIWQKYTGTIGGLIWVNSGTRASATWTNVV